MKSSSNPTMNFPNHHTRANTSSGVTRGGIYALAAEILWGILPIYFVLLAPTGPFELVAWRIILSFAFCAIVVIAMRTWRPVLEVLRQGRLAALTALAGLLIYANWQTYVAATLTGHVIEASMGYFISPLMTVLIGAVVLRERLRPLRWLAVGIAALAVVVSVIDYGAFPWIGLTLSTTFALYGLVKKQIGPAVDAISGLTLESFWVLPLAGLHLVIVAQTSGLTIGKVSPVHTVLLLLAGAVTAIPLLLFAAGARRVPLTVMGLLSFITPILQFCIGLWVLEETMTLGRWVSFALVWVAVIIFSCDSVNAARPSRRTLAASLNAT